MDDDDLLTPIETWNALSARQMECLNLVRRGLSSKEIARELGVSPSTVDNHIQYALNKLGIASRRDAARQLDHMLTRNAAETDYENLVLAETIEQRPGKSGAWIDLPPIGGRPNHGTVKQRVAQLIAIALLTLLILITIILTIAGAIRIAAILIQR